MAKYRRRILLIGILSGLAAISTPFLTRTTYPYATGLEWVLQMTILFVAPIAYLGITNVGLGRGREWARNANLAWGGLVFVTFLLRDTLPWLLLTPFMGAWNIVGNIGLFIGFHDWLSLFSAAIFGGLVIRYGYVLQPGSTLSRASDMEPPPEPTSEMTVDEEESLAEPVGQTASNPEPPDVDDADSSDRKPPTATETGQSATEEKTEDQATSPESPTTKTATETETASETAGEQSTEAAPASLTASDPSARIDAIESLTDDVADEAITQAEAVDALADVLESDSDTAVRVAVCEALGRLGPSERITDLLKEYRLDADTEVSQTASRILREFE